MEKNLHYQIQLGLIYGIPVIRLMDKRTNKYLELDQMEEWVELVGGVLED